MATTDVKCENCGTALGRLEDAFVWLDKPVCKPCFKHLAASRSIRYRKFWMPLALVMAVIAAGLGCALAVVLIRHGAWMGDSTQHVDSVAGKPILPASVLAMLRGDRTWYWHWERRDKDIPFKFVVDDKGEITTVGGGSNHEPGKPITLEQRWVLVTPSHLLVPINDHEFEGFFIKTGREVGAFTNQDTPTGN